MFEHLIEHLVHYVAGAMELIGVIIIALGGIKGLYLFIKGNFKFENEYVALELARAMSLGLSFLLGGEILHSILTKTIEGLIVLIGIAALRVGLHFVLHWEIKEINEELNHHEGKKEKVKSH